MKETERSRTGTRWRFRLVAIAIVNVAWSLSAVRASSTQFPFGMSAYGLVVGGSLLVLTPVFYHAIHRDIGAIRESDAPWAPDRRVWIGGGVVLSLLGVGLYLNPFTHYVAAIYLFRRYRKRPSTGSVDGVR